MDENTHFSKYAVHRIRNHIFKILDKNKISRFDNKIVSNSFQDGDWVIISTCKNIHNHKVIEFHDYAKIINVDESEEDIAQNIQVSIWRKKKYHGSFFKNAHIYPDSIVSHISKNDVNFIFRSYGY